MSISLLPKQRDETNNNLREFEINQPPVYPEDALYNLTYGYHVC